MRTAPHRRVEARAVAEPESTGAPNPRCVITPRCLITPCADSTRGQHARTARADSTRAVTPARDHLTHGPLPRLAAPLRRAWHEGGHPRHAPPRLDRHQYGGGSSKGSAACADAVAASTSGSLTI